MYGIFKINGGKNTIVCLKEGKNIDKFELNFSEIKLFENDGMYDLHVVFASHGVSKTQMHESITIRVGDCLRCEDFEFHGTVLFYTLEDELRFRMIIG